MKRLLLFLLMILPFVTFGQAVPGCGSFVSHSPITAVSNTNYSGYVIDMGGAATVGINIPAGVHDVHVTKCVIKNSTNLNGLIQIGSGCYNITIDTCFFQAGWRGIYAVGATNNIHLWYNYFYNIIDPNVTATSTDGGGSSIQLNGCNGTSIQILDNKSYHDVSSSGIGDQYSIYKCNGTSGSPIRCCRNQAVNGSTNPPGTGYVGMVGGDKGGSYQRCDSNTFVNVGSVLCQVQGGHDIEMSYNVGYLARTAYSNVGIAFGNYTTPFVASSNITIGHNRVYCIQTSGSVFNYWFDPATAFQPTDWTTNIGDNTLNASILPDPLFNTSCSTLSPPNISYSPNTYTITVGQSISANVINTGGVASSFVLTGSLPSGITLNATTGLISGTATATYATHTNSVLATNTSGNSTTNITFTVNAVPIVPPHTTYPSPQTYTVSNPIIPLSPNNTGGAVTSYSGTLPSGLTLNTSTGVISGVPVVVVSNTYNITAHNSAGNYVFPLVITVNPPAVVAPSIGYSPSSQVATYGYVLTNMIAANSGGAGTYSVSPSLPSGLSLNTSSGIISGTPSVVQSATNYTVTCTNTAGSSHATITLTINKAPLILTATNLSKKPGEANPTLKFTYGGLVNGDASITGLPTLTTTATTSSPKGNYPISIFGASSTKYSLQYVNGTLAVTNGVYGVGKIAVIIHVY